MNKFLSHFLAAAFGATVAVGVVRALTLPKKQADGVAKVFDQVTGAHVTGADVQGASVSLAGQAVNAVVAKETPLENNL